MPGRASLSVSQTPTAPQGKGIHTGKTGACGGFDRVNAYLAPLLCVVFLKVAATESGKCGHTLPSRYDCTWPRQAA